MSRIGTRFLLTTETLNIIELQKQLSSLLFKISSSKLMDGGEHLVLMCKVIAVMGFFVLWHN